MKVTNWRRNLAATLAAGGLISPAAARGADLDVNLLQNAGFETVDTSSVSEYTAVKILSWTGTGYAYSHHPEITGTSDFADGDDPPNAGNYYFTANNQPEAGTGDIREPDVFYQDLPVNAGASAAQIASGEAAVRFSAQMSSYANDNDFGIVHLQFKNASGTTLATSQISDTDAGPDNVWSLTSGAAFIPVGTTSIRTSLLGGVRNSGTDGYIDNVDVQVTNAANILLFAHVNTVSGHVSLRNQTGQPVSVDYYEIVSPSGALNRTNWNSLQDQNRPDFPAGHGSGDGWEEGGGGGNGAISESNLTGNSLVTNGANISLGSPYATAGARDLVFRYGVVGAQTLDADFDADGDVDGGDFLRWQRGLGVGTTKAQGNADGDNDVDAADLAVWKGEFGQSAFGGPSTLVQGFVRYDTSQAAAIPEPAATVLAGVGFGAIQIGRRREKKSNR